MKLIASLTTEEVKKLIASYIKKKTGKSVESIDIHDTETIINLVSEGDEKENE